jgi:sugar lactone lactonase YvrE
VAESLYVISGGRLVRADLDGSGDEVFASISNPHCLFHDFAIHASGAPYIVAGCSIPSETLLYRLRPDSGGSLEWETLLELGGVGNTITSIELSGLGPAQSFEVLYYATTHEIHMMAVDRSFDALIVSVSNSIAALDTDSVRGKIYWVEVPLPSRGDPGRIMRADWIMPTATPETVVTGLVAPNDLCVDEQSAVVYWSDSSAGTIQRTNVTGDQSIETVLEGLTAPSGIEIHSASQKLYWAEENRVRRSNLDGSMLEDVLSLYGGYRIRFGPDGLVAVEKTTWGQLKRLYR